MAHLPRHTIILIQETASPRTRTYYDFETKTAALDGVVRLFEEILKRANPHTVHISYDVKDLFTWMDTLGDISCLVLDPTVGKYEPHARDYLKSQIFNHLKNLAGK